MATRSSNWEDYACPDIIDFVKKIESKEYVYPDDDQVVAWIKETSLNPFNCHVLATPLLVLSSITVYDYDLKSFFDGFGNLRDECHVIVKVVDNDYFDFLLFDSYTCDAGDVLFFDGNKLDISLEKSKLNRPQWIPKWISLKLLLEDCSTKFEMVDVCYLNLEPNVVYDKQHYLKLYSQVYGDVFVRFSYFRYATLASVDCRLEKIGDTSGTEDAYADVRGAISARFRVRDQFMTRVLLNHQDGEFAILDTARLCWYSWLAVPAYSPLEILVDNLVINQEKIHTEGCNLKFEPNYDYSKTVEMVGQKWRLLVTVEWKHVYKFIPDLSECDYEDDVNGSKGENTYFTEFEESYSEMGGQSNEASSPGHQEKRARFQSNELPLSDVIVPVQRMDILPSLRLRPLELVEVFSISVCPYVNLDKRFFLCGTINCSDSFGEHEVFNGEKSKSSLLCPHQTILMVEPRRCYDGLSFSMSLDLKDDQGREMSRGHLSWCFVTAASWLDRRVCSVVRGKDGFAAVHYTLFSDASQARVGVCFFSKDRYPHRVYGTIRARYSGYRYFTQYDKKYYQSVLFQKGKDEYVTVHNGIDVPLSKVIVSVPLSESLIIVVNLKLVGDGEEILRGVVEFPAKQVEKSMIESEPQMIGELDNYRLVVSVSWG